MSEILWLMFNFIFLISKGNHFEPGDIIKYKNITYSDTIIMYIYNHYLITVFDKETKLENFPMPQKSEHVLFCFVFFSEKKKDNKNVA